LEAPPVVDDPHLLRLQTKQFRGFVGGELADADHLMGASDAGKPSSRGTTMPRAKSFRVTQNGEVMKRHHVTDSVRWIQQGLGGAVQQFESTGAKWARGVPPCPHALSIESAPGTPRLAVLEVFHGPGEGLPPAVGRGHLCQPSGEAA